MTDARRFADATARNREPILEVLRHHVRPGARVLEIASGTGEHAVFLAAALEVASWQPSDPDARARASIDAWRSHQDLAGPASTGPASAAPAPGPASASPASASRVLPALALDVTRDPWPALPVDLVVCINMVHISPWAATLALLAGAARTLVPETGRLYLYGPYRRAGIPTAASNEAFDASLRARDPSWGLRALEDLIAAAAAQGLSLVEVVEMPANNLSVVLARAA